MDYPQLLLQIHTAIHNIFYKGKLLQLHLSGGWKRLPLYLLPKCTNKVNPNGILKIYKKFIFEIIINTSFLLSPFSSFF